ncbi:MAG: hypothetical protein ACTSRI_02505 [Promethearchaeota archaeon]
MLAKNEVNKLESHNNIRIICPICKKKRELRIPSKIINQSKQLTTISIPSGLNCEHGFQAFIDKNYKVRGYQKIDFEFSNIEFFEGKINAIEGKKNAGYGMASLSLFQDIIKLLRECVDNKETLVVQYFPLKARFYIPRFLIIFYLLQSENLKREKKKS